MKSLWIIGAIIAFLGTFPILFELNFMWKLNGLILMGIGIMITIIFIEDETKNIE